MTTQNLAISTLPQELWTLVFHFLPLKEVGTVVRVCKAWQAIVSSDLFWQQLYQKHFATPVLEGMSIKKLVIAGAHWTRYLQEKNLHFSTIPLPEPITSVVHLVCPIRCTHFTGTAFDIPGGPIVLWNSLTGDIRKVPSPHGELISLDVLENALMATNFATAIRFIDLDIEHPTEDLFDFSSDTIRAVRLPTNQFAACSQGDLLMLFERGVKKFSLKLPVGLSPVVSVFGCVDKLGARYVVGAPKEGRLLGWNLDTGFSEPTWNVEMGVINQHISVTQSVSQRGDVIIAAYASHNPVVLDPATGRQLFSLSEPSESRESLSVSQLKTFASPVGIDYVIACLIDEGRQLPMAQLRVWSLVDGTSTWSSPWYVSPPWHTGSQFTLLQGPQGWHLLALVQATHSSIKLWSWQLFDKEKFHPSFLGESEQDFGRFPTIVAEPGPLGLDRAIVVSRALSAAGSSIMRLKFGPEKKPTAQ